MPAVVWRIGGPMMPRVVVMTVALVELGVMVTAEMRVAVKELESLEQVEVALDADHQAAGENGCQGQAAGRGIPEFGAGSQHGYLGTVDSTEHPGSG